MPAAVRAVSIILFLLAITSFGYAGWRSLQGVAISDSLPLFVSGVVCIAAMIAVSRGKKKAD